MPDINEELVEEVVNNEPPVTESLSAIADSIRNKTGSSNDYLPSEMAGEIDTLSSPLPPLTNPATAADVLDGKEVILPDANDEPVKVTGTLEVPPVPPVPPPEYQRVEYIKSSGTQYIDTGLYLTGDSQVIIDYRYDSGTASARVFGDATDTNAKFAVSTDSGNLASNANYQNAYGDLWVPSSTGMIKAVPFRNRMVQNKGDTYISDYLYFSTPYKQFTTAGTARIFGFVLNNEMRISSMYLYDAKIYDDGTEIAHFVPCYRKSDGEIGLYDLKRNQFFTNAGTGVFLKGGDVS